MKQFIALFAVVLMMLNSGSVFAQNWPQWRGPLATGEAPKGDPPTEWSETENIKWKVEIPGKGFSTPAIWGDDIFVTTAISEETGTKSGRAIKVTKPVKFKVFALDRKTGKVKWEKLAVEEIPHEARHPSGTWATASPITDGKRVYAFFGSRGLFCYTIEGELLWKKDFGDMKINNQFGEGSSPSLYKNRLIVNWDHMGDSFIVSLDASTGKEIWRNEREERTSWMTPLIVEVDSKPQVITGATGRVKSYDLETGKIVWEGEGLTMNVIPSPVHADGVAYLISGYAGNVLRAVDLKNAKGDITGTPAILWEYNQDTPYTPSPLLMGGMLYFLKNNNGILTCLDVSTGKANFSNQRLEGIKGVYSSPVGVNDKVYILGRDGVTLVITQGKEYNVLITNRLDDKFDSSPAIAGNEMFLRGYKYLYCIEEK